MFFPNQPEVNDGTYNIHMVGSNGVLTPDNSGPINLAALGLHAAHVNRGRGRGR